MKVDYAAVAGKSDETIARQTGLVHDTYGISGWWSQTVTSRAPLLRLGPARL
jgi:hypothetical protein